MELLLDLILQAGPNATTAAAATAAAAAKNASNTPSLGHGGGGRALGNLTPAVERARGFQIAGGRLMLFLAGAPNLGPGAVSPPPPGVDWGEGEGGVESGVLHDQFFRGEVSFPWCLSVVWVVLTMMVSMVAFVRGGGEWNSPQHSRQRRCWILWAGGRRVTVCFRVTFDRIEVYA